MILSIAIYYSLKSKTHCPNCKSQNIVQTGKKIYKEEPQIAVYGSPDSYNNIEYKCSKCGHIFLVKQKAVIFN